MAGRLAIVLHSHMPYVEGHGTWPFGEEWLFEAMATCYLPLLDVLRSGAPVTLSLTPVLCDQLAAPGLAERFDAFCRDVRAETHRRDVAGCRATGRDDLADELEIAADDYAWARGALADLGSGGLLDALAPHAAWTSSATHAVLALLATDAGVRLQVETGITSHRARFGAWDGGFWLPECAYAPWLDPLLSGAGVHAVCVDLTDVLGRGSERQLVPLRSDGGPLLVPIDREIIELVWSDDGYPAGGAYRDYHHRTTHDHNPWAVDGSVYDRPRAARRVRNDAADFVARVRERVAGGGLCVCALDTELLGHWWYEGIAWLREVVAESARRGLELVGLDAALADAAPAPAPTAAQLGTTTWGQPRDLSTWSAPVVGDLAFGARDAELRVVAAGAAATNRAVRELLALQSSDWAFLAARGSAGDYPRERAAAHRAALHAELRAPGSAPGDGRSLAPDATKAPLLAP